jgi:hypothetical protein
MKLNIKSRLVAAIAQFKATADMRYYLCGVYVEPLESGGAVIVGTDGNSIAVWLDETGEVERPAILRIDKRLEAACAGLGTKRLKIIDDRLTVVTDDANGEIYVQNKTSNDKGSWEISGTYPDWAKVIRLGDGKGSMSGNFDPKFIAKVKTALGIGDGLKSHCISMTQESANTVIGVLCMDAPNFVGCIMPASGAPAKPPEWLKLHIAQKALKKDKARANGVLQE